MSTPDPDAVRRVPAPLHDRATWWIGAITVLTLLGFQRTIATRLGVLDLAHLGHGVASLGWLLVLIAQAEFIRRHQRARHRALAVVGVVCAVALTATALPMVQATAAKAGTDPAGGAIGWFVVVMDTGLLLAFVMAFAVAVANVRRPAIHSRAMAATALVALPPGLGRWAMRLFHLNPIDGSYVALGVGLALLIVLIATDRRAGIRERVYPSMFVAMLLVTVGSAPIARRFEHPPVAAAATPRALSAIVHRAR
jgi:hypothetical protein